MLARTTLLLAVALVLPACHDGDDDDGGGGNLGPRTPGVSTSLSASLSGGQEAPPVVSFGTGTSTFFVPADRDRIDFTLNFSGLTGVTMVHVHLGAVGFDGPIIFDLSPTPFVSPLQGTLRAGDLRPQAGAATFQQAVDALLRGNTYVNVHTTRFPDGEIRGQIGPASASAALQGFRVIPPTLSSGSGTATLALNEDQTQLTFALDVANLSGPPTAARIHVASTGLNGPAVFDLATTMFLASVRGALSAADLRPQPGVGVVTFADAVDALLSGNAYVLVTTAAFPAGEIRGQLIPAGVAPVATPPIPPVSSPSPVQPTDPTLVTPQPVDPAELPPVTPVVVPVQNTGLPPFTTPSVPPDTNIVVPPTTPVFAPVTNPALPSFTTPSVPSGTNLGVPPTTPLFPPATNPTLPTTTTPVVPATTTTP